MQRRQQSSYQHLQQRIIVNRNVKIYFQWQRVVHNYHDYAYYDFLLLLLSSRDHN
jgi:hypothetical protein